MSTNGSDFKQRVDDLDLGRRAQEAAELAAKVVEDAIGKAGDVAHSNRDRVDGLLAKAEQQLDDKTEGKYHSYAAKVRSTLVAGVDIIAEQRPASRTGTGATDTPSDDYTI